MGQGPEDVSGSAFLCVEDASIVSSSSFIAKTAPPAFLGTVADYF
jgi:hypothetical protein